MSSCERFEAVWLQHASVLVLVTSLLKGSAGEHPSEVQLEQDEGQHQEHDNAWEYDSWQGEAKGPVRTEMLGSNNGTGRSISYRGRVRASSLVVATEMHAGVASEQREFKTIELRGQASVELLHRSKAQQKLVR